MKRFENGQRVRVSPGAGEPTDPLSGRTGTVVRLRLADSGAWVKMDEALPDDLRSFPSTDERCNNIILYPSECEPEND